MKICITGKGGCGKSMVSVLMSKVLAARGYSVLLVDADESNLGLQRLLGMKSEPKPLLEYLGGKPAIQKNMIEAFKQSTGEPKMVILPQESISIEDLPPDYIASADGISVLRIGKIEHAMEGCACPMGALAKDFLDKLTLGDKQVVITDHEAGLEHFGRGVERGVDTVLIIVDPSYESVLLAEKIESLAKGFGVRTLVVLNRATPDVVDEMGSELKSRGMEVSGSIGYDPEVFRACLKGEPLNATEAERDVATLVDTIGLQG
jgi:CO dehydrogenase maturation factor